MGIDDLLKDLSWQQLAIFSLFALPGFISLQVWSLITPTTERTLLEQLPEAIAFGLLNAAVAAPVALLWGKQDLLVWYGLLLGALVVLPALWPFALRWALSALNRIGLILGQEHTGWDAAFLRRQPYFVIVHLPDGQRLGGYYGYDSYASLYPVSGHLYLEEVWALDADGEFEARVEGSRGVILRPDDYKFVELFAAEEEANDG